MGRRLGTPAKIAVEQGEHALVVTLGGLGNPFGALVGSLIIGVFVELWTWIVPNANDLKTVGALVVLIVVLLIKPQGLLGTKERIG